MRVYKSDISYFSGKLEAYLRYKEIPHRLVDCNGQTLQFLGKKTGIAKMPAIELDNNQWLFDTTPTIQYLEKSYSDTPVLPPEPALRFLALLIEDYGDEWLWRPAMWWRWMPKLSRVTLGRRIAGIMASKALATPLGYLFAQRQLKEWLWQDGMDKGNSHLVRDMYIRELEFLESLLEKQPYILGSHPSVADLGFFGSMFRHFNNDPVSGEVMRRQGPNTYEYIARLWNAKQSKFPKDIEWQWPEQECWQPLLSRIANDYLPYLHDNALAFKQNNKRFDYKGKTMSFNKTVTTDYRVLCRQKLQREFALLSESDQQKVNDLFAPVGGLGSLHLDGLIDSGLDKQFRLPVNGNTTKAKLSWHQRLFGQPRN